MPLDATIVDNMQEWLTSSAKYGMHAHRRLVNRGTQRLTKIKAVNFLSAVADFLEQDVKRLNISGSDGSYISTEQCAEWLRWVGELLYRIKDGAAYVNFNDKEKWGLEALPETLQDVEKLLRDNQDKVKPMEGVSYYTAVNVAEYIGKFRSDYQRALNGETVAPNVVALEAEKTGRRAQPDTSRER